MKINVWMTSDLYVSDPQLSLHVVADHEVSQGAARGDLGLLDDVWAEGDLADVSLVSDGGGDRKLRFVCSTKTGSVGVFNWFKKKAQSQIKPTTVFI